MVVRGKLRAPTQRRSIERGIFFASRDKQLHRGAGEGAIRQTMGFKKQARLCGLRLVVAHVRAGCLGSA